MIWTTEDADVSPTVRHSEPPAFDAREAAARVAADMDAAFRTWVDVGPGPVARSVRRPRFGSGEAGGSAKRARLNLVTAVSVGVLVGVSVGALIARPHRTPAPPSASLAETAPPLAQSASIDPTAPASPRYLHVETEPSPAVDAAPPGLAQVSPPVRAAATATPGQIVASPDRHPDDGSWSGRRSVAWNAAPFRGTAGDAASAIYPRAGLGAQPSPASPTVGGQPDCIGQAVQRRRDCLIAASGRADAALRASYRQAAMAGVPNEVLEQDTQAWNDLRWRGGSEPEQMVAGYRRLTATLRAQAAAARREDMAQASGYDGYDRQYSPWD